MAIDPEVNGPADQLQAKEKDDKVARDKVIQYLTDFELIDKSASTPSSCPVVSAGVVHIIQQICYTLPSSSNADLKPVANLYAGPFPQ